MNIISDSSLDYLDEITNSGFNDLDRNDNVTVKPKIGDVGDIGVGIGVGI